MKAWEQQEKESDRAFEAFSLYLAMGPDRSTAKVAQSLSKSKTLTDRWSGHWNWRDRIVAHTQYFSEIALKAREKETAKQARKIISANEVLEELSVIAETDWREFVEIRRDKDGEVIDANLKLGDKLKALELAGKFHKLWADRLVLSSEETDSLSDTSASKYGLPVPGRVEDKTEAPAS